MRQLMPPLPIFLCNTLRTTAVMSCLMCRLLIALILLALASDTASAVVIAVDNAASAAYSDGWQSGDNGGTGFGPWSLSFSGSSALLYPPQFIDRAPLPGDSLGAPSFALTTGDQRNAFETSEARRTFVTPLAI